MKFEAAVQNCKFVFVDGNDNERLPLIRHYVQGVNPYSVYTESVANYHSAMGSPEGSLNGNVEGADKKLVFPPLTRDQVS